MCFLRSDTSGETTAVVVGIVAGGVIAGVSSADATLASVDSAMAAVSDSAVIAFSDASASVTDEAICGSGWIGGVSTGSGVSVTAAKDAVAVAVGDDGSECSSGGQ